MNNRHLFDFKGALKEGFINGSTVLDKRDSAVTQNKKCILTWFHGSVRIHLRLQTDLSCAVVSVLWLQSGFLALVTMGVTQVLWLQSGFLALVTMGVTQLLSVWFPRLGHDGSDESAVA